MDVPSLFFEQHPQPMFIVDSHTLAIEEANNRAVQKYGFSREEFRQLSIEDLCPPGDTPKLHVQLDKLGVDAKVRELGTFRHRTKEGEILYVQITTQRLPGQERDTQIVHIRDRTDNIRLKNKLKEANRDRQHQIDNNPLAMVKYDHNFRVIEWSKRAEEKTGYSREAVLGTSIFDMALFREKEIDFIKSRMASLSSGEKDRDQFEMTLHSKSGEPVNVLVHASAFRDCNNELKSVLAFMENISTRKTYQRQLHQREEKYHRLFEDANDGIFLLNGLTIIDCNEQAREIFGTPHKEDILGKSPLDFSPEIQPDGQPSAQEARERVARVRQGAPQVFEWKHRSMEGEKKDVEVSLNKVMLGEEPYVQAIVRDLTEHNKVKNKLKEEQQRLKRAQRLGRLGWWSYEAQENRVVWSDLLFDILGVEKKDFERGLECFHEVLHPDDLDKFEKITERSRQSRRPLDYTLRFINPKNDKIIYSRCRSQSKFDSEEKLLHVSGVIQNVTDQKKARNELKRREKLFESLFLNSPTAIAMIDVEGKVQKVNESFEELFGYTEEELAGKDLLKHQLPEERYGERKKTYSNLFSKDEDSSYFEDRLITKNGTEKDLLIGALPVYIEGDPIGAFGIYTDITTLRKTEEDLQESLNEKEVLLAEIHHRVKNNLAVICGLLELEAMNWEEDSSVFKVLTQSKLRIHSMARIHEQLYRSMDFANLSLDDYIKELVETIYQSMQEQKKEVELAVECHDVTLNINQAVSCALIVNELVTNAFKYAFEGDHRGKLEVSFTRDDHWITMVVRDNGPGLPQSFEAMTSQSLGHQLVNQLVKQLDGEIDVESSPESGTRYEIRFRKSRKSGSASHHFV